jgi:general secretion pathway protein A
MRLYNRPAVLELFGDDGRRHHLVLSALDSERATLDIAERQITVNLHELDAFWRGSYILLWTPPPSGSTLLIEGSSGPDILWLRSQLDSVSEHETLDVEGSAHNSHFDDGLKRRVMDFQRAHGLVADGAVGPQTLIQLGTTVGELSGPVLQQTTD